MSADVAYIILNFMIKYTDIFSILSGVAGHTCLFIMTIRTVITYPNAKLRIKSTPVEVFDQKLEELVSDMFETMYQAEGIGLAAPQIDIHKQIIVIDLKDENNQRYVVINPEFVLMEGSDSIEEGCLSVPLEYRAKVERSAHVVVKCQNEKGETYQIDATGLLAICLQHEIDHLQGKLFIDHISNLKRSLYESKLKKALRYEKKANKQ